MQIRTIPAIAAAAKLSPSPLVLHLPRSDIEAAIAHPPEQRGFLYDIELETEFRHLASQGSKKSLEEIGTAVAESFPVHIHHEPQISSFSPALSRHTTAFALRNSVEQKTYYFSHVSRVPETPEHADQLLIGKWQNRAGLYLSQHADELVTSAALMVLSEDELAGIFKFLDPQKDINDHLALLYLSEFDQEENLSPDTQARFCKLDTTFSPSTGIQTEEAQVHTVESFHEHTQGMIFIRNLSQALGQDEDGPALFLLGVIFYGPEPARLSQPFEIAFRLAMAESQKLSGLSQDQRLFMYREAEDNLGSALEGSKRDEFMWLHKNLWGKDMRERHHMSPLREKSL